MKSLREIAKKSSLSLDDLVAIEEAILQTGYMTHEKALAEIEHFAVDLGLDDSVENYSFTFAFDQLDEQDRILHQGDTEGHSLPERVHVQVVDGDLDA